MRVSEFRLGRRCKRQGFTKYPAWRFCYRGSIGNIENFESFRNFENFESFESFRDFGNNGWGRIRFRRMIPGRFKVSANVYLRGCRGYLPKA